MQQQFFTTVKEFEMNADTPPSEAKIGLTAVDRSTYARLAPKRASGGGKCREDGFAGGGHQ